MSPEIQTNPTLSAEQLVMAEYLIEACGLQDVADAYIEMLPGIGGTVRYGLGRCAHHFGDSTPADIRALVLQKLEQQGQ